MDSEKLNQAVNIGQEGLSRYSKKDYKAAKQKCLLACQKLQALLQTPAGDRRKQIVKQFIQKYLKGAENANAMIKNGIPAYRENDNKFNTARYSMPINDQFVKPLNNLPNQNKKRDFTNLISPKNQYTKQIENNMMEVDHSVSFNDIVGLQDVKKSLTQAIINPSLRPDLYMGVRAPPKGILFYGPPGNGKTMLAKAVAAECKSTFFNVSASTLLSKYVGDSQKMMKSLFEYAAYKQPSIIFIDQIDSILTKRNENQHEASRRLKTQFLIRLDGTTTTQQDLVLVIGATNLPNQLDKAALRRFNRKILIDLPDLVARKSMITKSLKGVNFQLSDKQLNQIAIKLEMYSASDIKSIIKEAAMYPIRQLTYDTILKINKSDIRSIKKKDFEDAIKSTPPTLSKKQYQKYRKFGVDKVDKTQKVGTARQQEIKAIDIEKIDFPDRQKVKNQQKMQIQQNVIKSPQVFPTINNIKDDDLVKEIKQSDQQQENQYQIYNKNTNQKQINYQTNTPQIKNNTNIQTKKLQKTTSLINNQNSLPNINKLYDLQGHQNSAKNTVVEKQGFINKFMRILKLK